VSKEGKTQSSDNTPHMENESEPTEAAEPTTCDCNSTIPEWNNEGESVQDYTSPPLIDWSAERVNEEFLKEPFCKLDLTESCIGSAEILQLKRLIIQYRRLFEPQKTKTVRGFEATVDVIPGSKPAVGRTYRQTHANDAILKQWIGKAIEDGLIEESTSPWRAGVLCIPKNNGQTGLEDIRVVHSFVKLNKVLEPVSWPLPRVDDLLNDIAGSQYLSALDLAQAFHQIPIKKNGGHRERLTFCTRHGLHSFTRMPMGMSTSSAFFQRFADIVIGDLRYKRGPANNDPMCTPGDGASEETWWKGDKTPNGHGCACVFVDDIAVTSQTVQGHLQD
jgi:hypothetical protein